MYGFAQNAPGVYGTSPSAVGVCGQGTRNARVFGASPVYGVWGRSTTGFGVNGEATGRGIGVYGKAGAGGYAGYFEGNVYVSGTVIQGGLASPQAGASQSGASQAASRPTVERFGTGRLSGGRASVTLDPEFAEMVEGASYAVVVTEEDDHNGLFVTHKRANGFDVRTKDSPSASSAFSYRVMASRRPAARTATADESAPSVTIPRDVPVPTPPEPPTVDRTRPDLRDAR